MYEILGHLMYMLSVGNAFMASYLKQDIQMKEHMQMKYWCANEGQISLHVCSV